MSVCIQRYRVARLFLAPRLWQVSTLTILTTLILLLAPAVARTTHGSCTDQWRAMGHTSQAKAKAFAANCLRREGAVDRKVTQREVRATLQNYIGINSPLVKRVPNDIASYCPSYVRANKAERAEFWQSLIAAIVPYESAYKTLTAYWEEGTLNQFSIGLLQLSFTDGAGYRCNFSSEADIASPDKNLSCGVKIMTKLTSGTVERPGTISKGNRGAARYWSTLRDSRVRGITRNLDVCR